jgi:hypothetical protein
MWAGDGELLLGLRRRDADALGGRDVVHRKLHALHRAPVLHAGGAATGRHARDGDTAARVVHSERADPDGRRLRGLADDVLLSMTKPREGV